MNINSKLNPLITAVLLISFSCFANAEKSVVGNYDLAPEANAAEATLSFRDIPYLKKAFIDTAPAAREDDLAVGELGIDGGNKKMIVKLAKELANNKHGDYDSLLIAHKGKFLFESYYKRGRINLPHFQSSATKGYTSLLFGRAIQLGYLTMADLDKPLVSFLKGLDHTKFIDGVEKITLHQAMTMRSGLRFSKEQMTKFRKNPEQFKGLAQIQAFLELSEPVTSKSQIYKYQGPDPIMVMHVLDAVVPGTAKDFIKNEFFGKLGITNYKWSDDQNGLPKGDEGLSMTSRDMLKLGVLVTNKGQWKGEQLLSTDYLAKATSAITRATEDWQEPETFFYGYLWYQTNVIVGDKNYDVKIAWGGGGNRVISVEALDLVVVITGLDWDDKIFAQVSNIILPAFAKGELPVPGESYLGQKPPGLIPEIFAPGVISLNGRYEHGISFSPDLEEVYFSANKKGEDPSIYFSKLEDRKWTNPKKVNFTNGKKVGEMHPFVNPKGDKLYFAAHDAFTLPHHKESVKTWYVNRLENSWSKAIQLDSPVNEGFTFYANQAKNGDLFYTNLSKGKMYYAPNENGKFPHVKDVGIEVGFHGFISPSQDYLVVNARNKEDGQRKSDIYVYFKDKGGDWSKKINLGNTVNSNFAETCPSITPDGKYLFFGRYNEEGGLSNFYWVSTEVITNLKTAYFKQ